MASNDRLGRGAARQFADQGFLVIHRAFDEATLESLRYGIAATVRAFDPDRHRTVFRTTDRDQGRDERFFRSAETVEYFLEEEALDEHGELRRPLDQAINKLGHALHDHVPAIRAFCRRPDIADNLRSLGLRRPRLWQSMVIFKQPGIGGEVRWHQDASYLHTRPATVVGMWIALEDARRDNGCLLVAPGAHRTALRERYRVDWSRRAGSLETLDETPWPEDGETLALEVPAGSMVLFSDHLPHASSANRSAASRQALTLHFAEADAEWSEENWLQRPTLPAFDLY